MLDLVEEGCPGHGAFHLLVASLASKGFVWDPHMLGWTRPGLPRLNFECLVWQGFS